MKFTYKTTIVACFIGYIVLAMINNFVPLLFVTFQNSYSIPLSQITVLITVNFCVQITVDFLASKVVDKIGYRTSIMIAHILSALGFGALMLLPEIIDPFTGILIAVVIYASGGGIIEVLISPIMESCPTDNKEKAMSLLHSFYCWGHVGVVLLSTIFFAIFSTANWRILTLIWMLIPIVNTFIFLKTPIASLLSKGEEGMTLKELFKSKVFWVLMLMMLCAGASEQGVSQWASAFAETGLNISKTAGDLAGPMAFAVLMGTARAIYGKFGDKINLDKFMAGCTVLCIASYLIICFAPLPILSLIGCGICGFSVGIMWPGTFSKASMSLRRGGTAMFAMLALAGDLGCGGGPTLVGFMTDVFSGNMQWGILTAIIFPIILLICIINRRSKKDAKLLNK